MADDRPLLDVAGIFRQSFQGVYRADGRQVGSYKTIPDLCAGRWFVLAGETAPPLSQLYIKELGFGALIPVAQACAEESQGVPSWATPAQRQAAQAAQAAHDARLIPPLKLPDLSFTFSPLPGIDFSDILGGGEPGKPKAGVSVSQLAIFGGLGLAAWLLLRRD